MNGNKVDPVTSLALRPWHFREGHNEDSMALFKILNDTQDGGARMLHTRGVISFIAVAVLICFCPARGAAAEKTAINKYSEILSTLDSSNLDSIAEATKAYQKLFADKRDLAAQDEAFGEWLKFAREVLNVELGRILESGLYYQVNAPYPTLSVEPREDMEPQAKQYLVDLRKRGLALQQTDETTEFVVRFSYIRNTFFPYLRDSTRRRFTLRNEYDEENFKYGDGQIPFENQQSWIIKFEAFVKQYPSSFEDGLQGMVQTYVLSGAEKDVVSAGQKKSFQQFLKENKNSRYYSLIKEYYRYLETHQFRPNVEVARKLLDKYNQLIKQ